MILDEILERLGRGRIVSLQDLARGLNVDAAFVIPAIERLSLLGYVREAGQGGGSACGGTCPACSSRHGCRAGGSGYASRANDNAMKIWTLTETGKAYTGFRHSAGYPAGPCATRRWQTWLSYNRLTREGESPMTVSVVYWSGTGNTRIMAEAIAEGARAAGAAVEIGEVASANLKSVLASQAIALGCPAMGAEVLEEGEMEPFVQSLETAGIKGKSVLLFGSYDWGDGQWMREWEARMEKAGARLAGKDYIVNLEPKDSDRAALIDAGKKLAASVA
jgi:flavodoxin I